MKRYEMEWNGMRWHGLGMGCQVEWHGMSQSVGYMASHIFGVRTSLRASAHDQLRLPAAAHCAEVWQHCLF